LKNKLKAIVVDDERLVRKNLIDLLSMHPEIEVIAEADSCKLGIKLVKDYKPDILFLDIQLAGETGFDLLEKVKIDFHLVFVTAYDEYAIRAFEVNACDYLLKPVNPERLKTTVERILNQKKPEAPAKKYNYYDCIYVKLNNSTSRFVRLNEIVSITSAGNYSEVLTLRKEKFLILKTLKQWEQELPENFFLRIHNSSIINIEAVERFEKSPDARYKIHLKKNNYPLEISRRYLKKIRSYFK
jgi:two-component system, LytTR family, response regulator